LNHNHFYFDTLKNKFRKWVNPFDLKTRLNWFSSQLDILNIESKLVLEVGCGLGDFSTLIMEKSGNPVPFDIGKNLVKEASKKFSNCVNGDALNLPFKDNSIAFILSSECIEHTSNPIIAIKEMSRVLMRDGVIVLTTPNSVWRWTVTVAKFLKLRKFNGIENWLSRKAVRRTLKKLELEVLAEEGLYILPFQFRTLWRFLKWINKRGQILKPWMINQCWVAKKANNKNMNKE